MASLKKQNLESKVLTTKGEEWVEEEESPDEYVKKDLFLMAFANESYIDEASSSLSTFEVDLSKLVSDYKA